MAIRRAEVLAPAGSRESLEAAVRAGADAVYLGGRDFNARRTAANFDAPELRDAADYCHERGVRVYLTLNTLVFDGELDRLRAAVSEACAAGVDAVLVQDLAVAALVREAAPSLPLHASTQMSVHNLDGVRLLEEWGFSRAVLARELSLVEIGRIARGSAMELECFVHGALCMSVSGQCQLSAMIGSRSGNRGLCAQPCRLPFEGGAGAHALSLKDMSHISHIPALVEAGVCSLKIEGRMKRPEYVAAAVHACRTVLDGGQPDYGELAAVFSRSGFTDGYLRGERGAGMFGIRQKEDVTAADGALLKKLHALYRAERQSVPVDFRLRAGAGEPCTLEAADGDGHRVQVEGEAPEQARTAPTSGERVRAALGKTGGTPYAVREIAVDVEEGLMLPAAVLNELRRRALEALSAQRRGGAAHLFDGQAAGRLLAVPKRADRPDRPALRLRFFSAAQVDAAMLDGAALVSVPLHEWQRLDGALRERFADRLAAELPRTDFDGTLGDRLKALPAGAQVLAGSAGAVRAALDAGLRVHGDFGLNVANTVALEQYASLGLESCTLSFEATLQQARAMGGATARGVLAYGYLPLMLLRNCPRAGSKGGCAACGKGFPELVDRKGERFFLSCTDRVAELHNCVPLVLSDEMETLRGLDFATLYFTRESREACAEVLRIYREGEAFRGKRTRGLYQRGVK